MNFSKISNCDIANGPGVRVTLFVSGCRNHCKGCFQPETWNFDYGQLFTKEAEGLIIELLSKPYIDGLTLLGGEPFEPENQTVLVPFLHRIRNEIPEKTVWCYTGYTWEQLKKQGSPCHTEITDEMISLLDVLVDGPYDETKRDISLAFRGSTNQRILYLRNYNNMEGTLCHTNI